MTSQINTNGINTNYPVPGQNNSSQGFRDNFAQIKTNINTAATEITDLQSKVVLKAALNNSVLNNDMANTVISNCATQGFRSTTYNLGNALDGVVVVDANKADLHYGTATGNVLLQFGNWAPTNTASNVTVKLTISDPNIVVSLPSQCVSSNNNFGVTLLENYANINGYASFTAPANANVVELTFSTLDCGSTITVTPVNRPQQSTQIVTRDIPPTGVPGDVSGTIAVGPSVNQLNITSTNSADYFVTGNTSQLYTDLPIVFTGTSMEAANITVGTTYYVRNVVSTTQFTVSSTIGGGNVNLAGNVSPTSAMYANPASYLYISTDSYNSTATSKTLSATNVSGNITLNSTAGIVVNDPIIFGGTGIDTVHTNLVAGTVYYIKTISSPNVTVSLSRVNGIAGTTFLPGTKTGLTSATATVYTGGNDIWKRINLTSW
jgi:hypothetical protein